MPQPPQSSRSATDLIAGLIMVGVGILTSIEAVSYGIGTTARMGPGYFPFVLGIILFVLGIGIMIVDRRIPADTEPPQIAVRPLLAILSSVLVFSAVVQRFGLAPAVVSTVLVSAIAEERPSIKLKLVVSVATAVFTGFLFIYLLGLRLDFVKW